MSSLRNTVPTLKDDYGQEYNSADSWQTIGQICPRVSFGNWCCVAVNYINTARECVREGGSVIVLWVGLEKNRNLIVIPFLL